MTLFEGKDPYTWTSPMNCWPNDPFAANLICTWKKTGNPGPGYVCKHGMFLGRNLNWTMVCNSAKFHQDFVDARLARLAQIEARPTPKECLDLFCKWRYNRVEDTPPGLGWICWHGLHVPDPFHMDDVRHIADNHTRMLSEIISYEWGRVEHLTIENQELSEKAWKYDELCQ